MEDIRQDKEIRLFKALKNMPHHQAGDLLYLLHSKSDICLWVDEPSYKVDLWVIENSPDDFEEIFVDFKTGDEFHFINLQGGVSSDFFHALKHAKLLRTGNGFKTLEEAEWSNEQIRKFLQDKGYVLTQNDFLQIIQWIQEDDKSVVIQKIRERYLF